MKMKYIEEMAQLKADMNLTIDNITKSLIDAHKLLDNLKIPNPIGIEVYLKDHPYNRFSKIIYRFSDNQPIGIFGIKEEHYSTQVFIKIHGMKKILMLSDKEDIEKEVLVLFDYFCLIPVTV